MVINPLQTMRIFKNLNKIFFGAAVISLALLSSCVDDTYLEGDPDGKGQYAPPIDDPTKVILPLGICFDVEGATRAEESENPLPTGVTDGNDNEHQIDFDIPNECYAIFFRENTKGGVKVKYVLPLFTSEQLGLGEKETGSYSEFSVSTVAYIPCDDTEEDEETGYLKPKLTKVLVVLNGGKIYNMISQKVDDLVAENTNYEDDDYPGNDLMDFYSMKWTNAAAYDVNDPTYLWNKDRNDSMGRIGFNSKEHYTMTNSTYYEVVDINAGTYKIHKASDIQGYVFSTLQDYLDYINYKKEREEADENDETDYDANPHERGPSTSVYVERMVAKFTSPTFSTEVIGAERVFRPDQNALPLVVYKFDKENDNILTSEQHNWRIHLLGWAINGDESETYIFKEIPQLEGKDSDPLKDWNINYWNDWDKHRSYWSIDPHYFSEDAYGNNDFYPWQFRKAADRDDIISISAGLTQPEGQSKVPVLRYNSFNDVVNEWMWRDVLHVHENTYDPFGNWYNQYQDNLDNQGESQTYQDDSQKVRNPTYLDQRASVLAGPHLLLVGEVYLDGYKGQNGYLNNQFGPVEHLYSDRIRRYYTEEIDWFKMFIREFNRSLATQESMTFWVHNWDENSEVKRNDECIVTPTGECRVFLRHSSQLLSKEKIKEIDPDARFYDDPDYVDQNNKPLINTELTFKVLDYLVEEENDVTISSLANASTGDGRLVPWLQRNGKEWMEFGLIVRDPKGNKLPYRWANQAEGTKNTQWTGDMVRSLFYEWFGPIDHYLNGYMYYAGEIKHRVPGDNQTTTFYGTVRNHQYSFRVASINALGIPVDDVNQLIIPGRYNYQDQLIVYLDVISWHSRETVIDLN